MSQKDILRLRVEAARDGRAVRFEGELESLDEEARSIVVGEDLYEWVSAIALGVLWKYKELAGWKISTLLPTCKTKEEKVVSDGGDERSRFRACLDVLTDGRHIHLVGSEGGREDGPYSLEFTVKLEGARRARRGVRPSG